MSSDHDSPTPQLTYADAGVDIDRADAAKDRIKKLARTTFSPAVLRDVGSFGGLFRPDLGSLNRPVLVSSADGVGTKLKLAFLTGIHNTVGVDLVAHCTNDILVQGAVPLFFLDYIASGWLDGSVIEQVVEGLARGCREAGCALLGGETAEMPDFYQPKEYDLAGFIVGIVDEFKILGADRVQPGDVLIGLPSSGLHTNGFSLARKVFLEVAALSLESHVAEFGRSVGAELLEPHRNYLPVLRELLAGDDLHAMAHITGGGIPGNLNRILPASLDARVNRGSWEIPPVFRFLRNQGRISDREMYRTFNMGVGMILIVDRNHLTRVESFLQRKQERYMLIGEVVAGSGKVEWA